MNTKTDIFLTVLVMALLLPFNAWTEVAGPSTGALIARGQPFEKDLIITAYYSPLPSQCCYVRGNFAADAELNGNGVHGADGTAVYPGMVAAPPSYPFGTRIVIPGIGTVTVHDRGGAIQELQNADRLDLWAGFGEEGLARALAFGVQHIHVLVYPVASPQPAESMDLSALPSPPEKLLPYLADATTLFDIHAAAGDHTASVEFLQQRLGTIGYFSDKTNGVYGPATRQSVHAFNQDMHLSEPDDHLTENTAAYLEAAYARSGAPDAVASPVDIGSAPARIADAERTLRFLGYYHGRTDGQYGKPLQEAVLNFQKDQGIVASADASGAGRIGPKTRQGIVAQWKRKLITLGAGRLIATRKVDEIIAKRGEDIGAFLVKGDHGDDVRTLQKFLAVKGYLGKDDITGKFGKQMEDALIAYQKDTGIIAAVTDQGAGIAGPATLARYRQDLRHSLLQIVRAKGWAAI